MKMKMKMVRGFEDEDGDEDAGPVEAEWANKRN